MGYQSKLDQTEIKLARIARVKQEKIAEKRRRDFLHKMDKEDNIRRI